jgi:hypothetical protein
LIRSAISLIDNKDIKKNLKDEYKNIKDDYFDPYDPIISFKNIEFNDLSPYIWYLFNNWPQNNIINPSSSTILVEQNYKYVYCTDEWYKWSSSRFIPAIFSLFFAIVEVLFALEKVDVVKGLTYGFVFRIIFYLGFGFDVLGVSGDLGISAGIILIVLILVWVICFLVGAIDKSKIGDQ